MIGYIVIFTLAFFGLLKIYNKYTLGICRSEALLHGKTAIVTGANTGIGKETARDLAKRGAKVILACRDNRKGEQARDEIIESTGNKNVLFRQLDLSSLKSVRQFVEAIKKSEKYVHILINNAGAGGLHDVFTQDNLQIGMQVNHFGPFLLTLLLLDLLKKSAPSRIIMVSSVLHKYAQLNVDKMNIKCQNDVMVYANSKLCNILFANELARKLRGTGVTVNSLHPGAVKTEIFRRMPKYLLTAANFFLSHFAKTPVEGAQTTIYLAVSEDVDGVSGKYFADCKEAAMSPAAQNVDLAQKMWLETEKLVGLKTSEKLRYKIKLLHTV